MCASYCIFESDALFAADIYEPESFSVGNFMEAVALQDTVRHGTAPQNQTYLFFRLCIQT